MSEHTPSDDIVERLQSAVDRFAVLDEVRHVTTYPSLAEYHALVADAWETIVALRSALQEARSEAESLRTHFEDERDLSEAGAAEVLTLAAALNGLLNAALYERPGTPRWREAVSRATRSAAGSGVPQQTEGSDADR